MQANLGARLNDGLYKSNGVGYMCFSPPMNCQCIKVNMPYYNICQSRMDSELRLLHRSLRLILFPPVCMMMFDMMGELCYACGFVRNGYVVWFNAILAIFALSSSCEQALDADWGALAVEGSAWTLGKTEAPMAHYHCRGKCCVL